MMNTAWIWTAFAVIAAISVLKSLFLKKKGKKLPPGPRGLPILGHFHLVGKNPHQDLHKLAKTYGQIMHLRFGLVHNIVASTPEAAKQFLKTHDLNFATRPPSEAAKYISNGQKGLSFGQYGPYWRNVRKLCTLEFLSNLKINSYQSLRREELCLLVESIKQAAQNREPVDLSSKASSLSANMSCRMVFGKKYEDKDLGEKGFKAAIQEAVTITAIPNLGDYFPLLGKLDVQGLTKRMKAVGKLFDEFLEKIINDHEEATSKGKAQTTKDFVDTILEIMKSGQSSVQFTREHVKSVMLDILIASIDTSSSVIEWTMSELFRYPEIMEKVKEEIESHVGLDRMVEESDLEHFKYLEIVIKESLRMHPVVPLLLPHAAIEDCEVDGFHIPKGSTVTVNVWAIGRDPNVWTDPEKFFPERFNKSSVEYRGQDFELLPFGSGRRSCPGMQLGITVVRLVVAQLLHCFDWKLPNGMLPKDLDMTEESGLSLSRAEHLRAIPTYRLHI